MARERERRKRTDDGFWSQFRNGHEDGGKLAWVLDAVIDRVSVEYLNNKRQKSRPGCAGQMQRIVGDGSAIRELAQTTLQHPLTGCSNLARRGPHR